MFTNRITRENGSKGNDIRNGLGIGAAADAHGAARKTRHFMIDIEQGLDIRGLFIYVEGTLVFFAGQFKPAFLKVSVSLGAQSS